MEVCECVCVLACACVRVYQILASFSSLWAAVTLHADKRIANIMKV